MKGTSVGLSADGRTSAIGGGARLYYEEVAVVFYAPQMQGHVAPEYVIDWVTHAEGELFALLARAVVQACNEETLMQGEVKKKWLKEGRSRDRRRHSRSTTLGATWPCFGIGARVAGLRPPHGF